MDIQAKAARAWAQSLQQQLSDSEAAAADRIGELADRIDELEAMIAVLNAQLDEASSHTDHSEQESFYSHFDGKGIFGGGNLWLNDLAVCASGDKHFSSAWNVSSRIQCQHTDVQYFTDCLSFSHMAAILSHSASGAL